jgi:hypothetical protein
VTPNLWKTFFVFLAATLAVVGGLGWLVSRTLVTPPPQHLMTAAFQMDLPPGWRCDLEGSEWVCTPGPPPTSSVAIIAMKYRNNEDSLGAYAEHLRAPQPATRKDGSTEMSKVEYVKQSRVGGYDWVDALHLGSELKGYYTHYLATVTSHVGILVTFSAYEKDFARYDPELKQMIGSLLVYQQPPESAGAQLDVGLAAPAEGQ